MSHETNPAVEVTVKNYSDFMVKPRLVKRSTMKTYVIDPAGLPAGAGPKNIQICEYEPNRYRMVIRTADSAIALTLEVPIISPDSSAATSAPQGLLLSTTFERPYEFYGPDAMWINSLAAVTRVIVLKEYC